MRKEKYSFLFKSMICIYFLGLLEINITELPTSKMQTLLEVEQNLRLKYMAFSAVCLQAIEFNKVLSEMVKLLNFFKRFDLPLIFQQ